MKSAQAKNQKNWFGVKSFVKTPDWFCPIAGCMWHMFLEPHVKFDFKETTHGLHLWNEMWRRAGVDKNEDFHPDSLYEKLKKEYL